MVKMMFDIPIYNIHVLLIQGESNKDADVIKKEFKKFGLNQTIIDEVTDYLSRDFIDGADTFFQLETMRICMFAFPITTPKIKRRVYDHEKRHVEDRVLKHLGIDDMEAASYLAGYLGERFYEFEKLQDK